MLRIHFDMLRLMRFAKKLVALLGIASVPILVCVCWLASMWMPGIGGAVECRNEHLSAVSSPDGEYDAYLYLRNCGMTVGYTTHVTVLRAGEEFKGGRGNAFQVLTWADDKIDLIWRNDHTLGIYHEVSSEHISKETGKVGNITILYGQCQNNVISQRVSPSGENRAVVFVRHCGPYHGYSSHVDLWNAEWDPQPGKGRILQAYGDLTEDAFFLHWNSDEELEIWHRIAPRDIVEQRDSVWGIQIEYSELSE